MAILAGIFSLGRKFYKAWGNFVIYFKWMIKQVYVIKSPVKKVWRALVDPEIIERWGAGPARMDTKEGSEFSLWGGDIRGKNIQIVDNKKIVQEWYAGNWSKPSIVSITLKSKGDITQVNLRQKDVPKNEEADVDDGWSRYYFGEIKKLLEN